MSYAARGDDRLASPDRALLFLEIMHAAIGGRRWSRGSSRRTILREGNRTSEITWLAAGLARFGARREPSASYRGDGRETRTSGAGLDQDRFGRVCAVLSSS